MSGFNFQLYGSNSIRPVLLMLLSLLMLNTSGQQKRDDPWYKNKLLRIYHPNMRNWEVTGFDVAGFVEDCSSVNAEAIVVNAGGLYAFYPSKIEYHTPNPYIGNRDLFGEICEEAKKRNLKIIARLDFAGTSSELAELHPEWFHINKDGSFKSHRGTDYRFATTPTGGYQNEDFAHKVLNELIDNYDISGIHLNGPGFDGISYDNVSMKKYGSLLKGDIFANPEMAGEFNSWRQHVVAEMIHDYRKILHEKDKSILLMAEIAGAEDPGWAYQKGFDNYLLSSAFTNLLLTTGRMNADLYNFRYWIGLSAEMAHAARPDFPPIINLKVPSGGMRYSDFQKPVEEFWFYCYQAVSHNAGLKIPTYGVLQTQQDTRSKEMISSIFKWMKTREQYAVNPKKINQAALVYPKMGIEDVIMVGEEANMGLRNEFLGLYRAMADKHIQFDVLYDHILMEYELMEYNIIVVPTMVYFNNQQIAKLHQFMKNGGRLVLLDNSYSDRGFIEIPDLFRELTGINWTMDNGTGNYAVPYAESYADQDIIKGPIGMATSKSSLNYRLTNPSKDCEVWLNASLDGVYKETPENIGKLIRGENALLWSKQIGKGELVYFGRGLGDLMYRYDHPDYTDLLYKMIFHNNSTLPLITTNAPSTVEINLHETENGHLIQFINGTGKIPLDQIIPVSNISVTLSKQVSVNGMVYQPGKAGYETKGIVEKGKTTFTINQLDGFAEILVPFQR